MRTHRKVIVLSPRPKLFPGYVIADQYWDEEKGAWDAEIISYTAKGFSTPKEAKSWYKEECRRMYRHLKEFNQAIK